MLLAWVGITDFCVFGILEFWMALTDFVVFVVFGVGIKQNSSGIWRSWRIFLPRVIFPGIFDFAVLGLFLVVQG